MSLIRRIILTMVAIVALASCGSYAKLQKSQDSQKKYTEGVKYFYAKDFSKSLSLLGDVAQVFQGSQKEDTIMFYLAKSLYNTNSFEESADMMHGFRNRFPRSKFTEESEYIYAMCFYNRSGTFERDQSSTKNAISAFTEYLNRYPESIKKEEIYEMIDELTRKIYMKAYGNAAIYYKLGKYNAAVTSLRSTLSLYPEIPYKEEIMYLICKSWYDYAVNSVSGKQLDRYMKMMDAYYSYKGEFSNETKRLEELTKLYNKSKEYTDKHGYQAKALAKDKVDIEARKNAISEKKDLRFRAKTKAEKQAITNDIQYERIQLKAERKAIRDNKKEMDQQAQNVKEQQKAASKEAKQQLKSAPKEVQETIQK